MFWLGFAAGLAAMIFVMGLSCFWISGQNAELERQRDNWFYPNANNPELEAGEVAEWNTRGHWEIYKNGEHIRNWPEYQGEE